MLDYGVIAWWTGGVIAGGAAVLLLWSLVGDRSRGRRRCPRCWYDMSGVTGLRCPECGRAQRRERSFFRSRRRWRGVALGVLVLVLGAGTAVAPAAYTGKWARYTPIPVLRAGLWLFDAEAERLLARVEPYTMSTLTPGERLLVAHALGKRIRQDSQHPRAPAPSPRDALRRYGGTGVQESLFFASWLGEEVRPILPELALAAMSPDYRTEALAAHEFLGRDTAPNAPVLRGLLMEVKRVEELEDCIDAVINVDAGRATRGALNDLVHGSEDAEIRLIGLVELARIQPDLSELPTGFEHVLRTGTPVERLVTVRLLGILAGSKEGGRIVLDTYPRAYHIMMAQVNGHAHPLKSVRGSDARRLLELASGDADEQVRMWAVNVLKAIPADGDGSRANNPVHKDPP